MTASHNSIWPTPPNPITAEWLVANPLTDEQKQWLRINELIINGIREEEIKKLDKAIKYQQAATCSHCSANPALFTVAEMWWNMVIGESLKHYDKTGHLGKFWDITYIPSSRLIRAYIWELSGQQGWLIECAKESVRYCEDRSALGSRLEWLRVLNKIKYLIK